MAMVSHLLDLLSQIPWLSDNPRIRRWEIVGLSVGTPLLIVAAAYLIVSVVAS